MQKSNFTQMFFPSLRISPRFAKQLDQYWLFLLNIQYHEKKGLFLTAATLKHISCICFRFSLTGFVSHDDTCCLRGVMLPRIDLFRSHWINFKNFYWWSTPVCLFLFFLSLCPFHFLLCNGPDMLNWHLCPERINRILPPCCLLYSRSNCPCFSPRFTSSRNA